MEKYYAVVVTLWIGGITVFGASFNAGKDKTAAMIFAFVLMAIAALLTFIPIIAKRKGAKEARTRILNENIATENDQRRLSKYEGLGKYVEMHAIEVANYQKGIQAMREIGVMMERSVYQEKEKDWAIHGGIAQGIAGPIAGIAAAANTMQENAKIQAQNAARREWAAKQNQFYQELANEAEQNQPRPISRYQLQQKYDAILSWAPSTLFALLEFSEPKVEITPQIGSVSVTVSWSQQDRSLCIDGSLRAKLYGEDGACAGCAYLVLPKVGTTGFRGTLSGICAQPKKSKTYTVVIEPINLWELAPKGKPVSSNSDHLSDEEHRRLVADGERKFLAEI